MIARRLIAAVMLACAALIGSAGTASATPVALPPLCGTLPVLKGNSDTFIGNLDVTAPEAFPADGGLYSRVGWAGWGQAIAYNPGCFDSLLARAGDYLSPLPLGDAIGGQSEQGGPNRVIGWLMSLATFFLACAVTLIRLATGGGEVWRLLDTAEGATQLLLGATFFVPYLTVGVAATGLWFMWRANKDSLGVVTHQSVFAFVMLAAGAAVIAYQFTVAPAVDSVVREVHVANGYIATGQENEEAPVDPGTRAADELTDSILLRTWGIVHLGPNMDIVDQYAERLFLASTRTRAEDARAQMDGPYALALNTQKTQHWIQVAGEVKAADADSYKWLEGADSDARVPWAVLGLLASFLILTLVGGAAVIVAFCYVAIRVVFAVFPAVALITQHPRFQRHGAVVIEYIWQIVLWAAIATVGLIVSLRTVMSVMDDDSAAWIERIVALLFLGGVCYWLWTKRKEHAERMRVRKAQELAERSLEESRKAMNRLTDAVTGDGSLIARQYEQMTSWKKDAARDNSPFATFHENPFPIHRTPAAAAPPAVATTDAVQAVVAGNTKATNLAKARHATIDPILAPRAAEPQRVANSATLLKAGRATETGLTIRESAALTARTAKHLPLKATAMTVRSAAPRTTSTAAVRAAASTITRKATVSTVSGPAATLVKIKR